MMTKEESEALLAEIHAEIEAIRARHPAPWDVKQLVRQTSTPEHLKKVFEQIEEHAEEHSDES